MHGDQKGGRSEQQGDRSREERDGHVAQRSHGYMSARRSEVDEPADTPFN
jgi:hypothetical protein